jgi:hypothetical protein
MALEITFPTLSNIKTFADPVFNKFLNTLFIRSGASTGFVTAAEAEFSISAEVTNTITVGVSFVGPDLKNQEQIAQPLNMYAYLSDVSTGVSITATAPSGGLSAATGDLQPMIANKAFRFTTDSNGEFSLAITNNTVKTYYLVVVLPNGILQVSSAINFT